MIRTFPAASVAMMALAAASLAACNLAPDYNVPDTVIPAAYKETGDWKQAQPGDEMPKGTWWLLFGDDRLNGLEDKVADANQDLKAAYARFQEARAQVEVAGAAAYPQVNGNGQGTRQRRSQTISRPVQPTNFSDYQLTASVSYEIDVWGRVRNSIASAKDSEQASAGDLAATDLDIRAELAGDYFMLRGFDTQQRILDETVTAFAAALDLIGRRHEGGVQPAADVAEAQGQLETAKTQASDNRLRRAQLEHAIAILVGEPPSQFSLAPLPLDNQALPAVDAGLPSSLLERRPDVAAAERRVAAANANIGVARAAYYPVFSLDALVGFETQAPLKLLQAPSSLWAFGPQITDYIFDGGKRDGLTDEARAAYDETIADYRQTVLSANGEVEDNLAALNYLDRETKTEKAAVTATQQALDQAKLRYGAGLVTYIEVVDTENAALTAQLTEADIETRRIASSVQLIKALGGGWQADTGLKLADAEKEAGSDMSGTKP